MWRHSPHSRTGRWIIRGQLHASACDWSTRRGPGQSRLFLFGREKPWHQNKLPLVRFLLSCHFRGSLLRFLLFLQRGSFRVIRDEHKRLKRLTMILWRLLLMCVTSALRAASSQTQEGRPINYLSTSALQQTVTEKLISHIFLNLFFFFFLAEAFSIYVIR